MVRRGAHSVVYAPSDKAARGGEQEVQAARERFRKMFGVAPINLVVLLADNPRQFNEIDVAGLRIPGARFLPFVTQHYLDSSGGEFGGPTTEVQPLAHEACHVFLSALTEQAAPPSRAGPQAYNHRRVPDWFNEAVATLCEAPAARAERRREFRALLDHRIPLREFERMPHPLTTAGVFDQLEHVTTDGHAAVRVVPRHQLGDRASAADVELFYSQAFSLGEFIAERGGAGALARLAQLLSNGRTLDEALQIAHQSVPQLPPSRDGLETAWVKWVSTASTNTG